MTQFLLVAAGGAIGASLRHLVNLAAVRAIGPSFPWATLTVNVAGSFCMGLFAGWLTHRLADIDGLRSFVAVGILGGFTTFSAFSLDVAVLWERGAAAQAAGYVLASVAGSILSLFAGLWMARAAF